MNNFLTFFTRLDLDSDTFFWEFLPRVSEEKVKIICFVFLANFFVLGHTLGNLDLK